MKSVIKNSYKLTATTFENITISKIYNFTYGDNTAPCDVKCLSHLTIGLQHGNIDFAKFKDPQILYDYLIASFPDFPSDKIKQFLDTWNIDNHLYRLQSVTWEVTDN